MKRIMISGAHGFIGSTLEASLVQSGDEVLRLVRSKPALPQDIFWDPYNDDLDARKLEGVDAVIHLAGENITAKRWTPARKALLRRSRIDTTRFLCHVLASLKQPPPTVITASAVGYYGDCGDAWLFEESVPGSGFLPALCEEWERATEPTVHRGIRVVMLRTGMVLGRAGGALATLLPLFTYGFGGKLGSGHQYISWIALDDLVRIVRYVLTQEALRGPVNVVAPHPVTNAEFTQTLGQLLHRPTFFSVPAFALRLLKGDMADALLLASSRVEPRKLLANGYTFSFPFLQAALREAMRERK